MAFTRMKNQIVIHGGANSPSTLNPKLREILSQIDPEKDALTMAIKPVVKMEDDPTNFFKEI